MKLTYIDVDAVLPSGKGSQRAADVRRKAARLRAIEASVAHRIAVVNQTAVRHANQTAARDARVRPTFRTVTHRNGVEVVVRREHPYGPDQTIVNRMRQWWMSGFNKPSSTQVRSRAKRPTL